MKLQLMLKYIISTIILCISLSSFGQTETETVPLSAEQDSLNIAKNQKYGLRIGVDISKPVRMLLEDDYRGIEVVADFRVSNKFYAAVELGNEKKTVDDNQQNFTTEGSFIKIGFDYNAYENWFGMQNAIYAGLRYGFSTHSQTLNSYKIYQPNHFLEDEEILGTDVPREYKSLNGHWIEAVAGVKVEVYNNVYLGISLRLNRLLSSKEPDNFENLFIPGFNKVTSDSNIGVGFNYTISYSIPIYKKAKKIKDEEEKEEN